MDAIRPHLAGKQHIIWDWNGTLLNDIELCVNTMTSQLSEHGLDPLTVEQYRAIFEFPVINYYKKLGFSFAEVPFQVVADEFMKRYKAGVHQCQLFAGVRELLTEIKTSGKKQSILSAAHEIHLKQLLKHFGVFDLFDQIRGAGDHYAVGKAGIGRELMKEVGVDPAHTLLIGDTDHDKEVATELGIDILLLGDGHQSYERLIAIHPKTLRSRYSGGN